MIFYFKQVCNLSVGFFGQIEADLNIDSLVSAYGHKIDFFCIFLSDVDIIAFSAKLKVYDSCLKIEKRLAEANHRKAPGAFYIFKKLSDKIKSVM